MWASGSDLSIDGTGTNDVSAFMHEGETGGFAIGSVNMSTYFDIITIEATGGVYGGAGGGGGGVMGVSAESMPNLQYLSAGCGGGGGQGVHSKNVGAAGLAAVSATENESTGVITITQDANFDDIHLANGNVGSTTGNVGGLGGAFTDINGTVGLGSGNVAITAFPAMSGLDGGALGEPGGTDGNIPVLPNPPAGNTGSGFSTISAEWAVRAGGDAGSIVSGTFTSVTSSGTGAVVGHRLNEF